MKSIKFEELKAWAQMTSEHWDEEYQAYYYVNADTGESQNLPPRTGFVCSDGIRFVLSSGKVTYKDGSLASTVLPTDVNAQISSIILAQDYKDDYSSPEAYEADLDIYQAAEDKKAADDEFGYVDEATGEYVWYEDENNEGYWDEATGDWVYNDDFATATTEWEAENPSWEDNAYWGEDAYASDYDYAEDGAYESDWDTTAYTEAETDAGEQWPMETANIEEAGGEGDEAWGYYGESGEWVWYSEDPTYFWNEETSAYELAVSEVFDEAYDAAMDWAETDDEGGTWETGDDDTGYEDNWASTEEKDADWTGWEEFYDEDGAPYWFNQETGETHYAEG